MSNAVTISTILNATALELLDSLSNVRGNRTELRVRHQATGAEDLTKTANLAHLVRSSNSSVEVELASLNLSSQLLSANDVSTSLASSISSSALSEHSNTDSLARAVRQGNRAAQLLISLTRVDAQTEVSLNSLVELRGCNLVDQLESLKRSVGCVTDLLDGSAISLGMLSHVKNSFRGA